MTKKITCKTGLKKDIISKNIFNREVELCRTLSSENGGKCGWGKCKDCGVIPLLIKLQQGKLLEGNKEIKIARREYLR